MESDHRTEMPRFISVPLPCLRPLASSGPVRRAGLSKTFQNLGAFSRQQPFHAIEVHMQAHLRFSSLLAVATVQPSGLRVECRTRVSCAWLMSAILLRPGYDQTESWLSGKPWEETNSRPCGFHKMLVTCELVVRELRRAEVVVFQKCSVL